MARNQNNYIIMFDENGDAYIAHGWLKDTANKVTSGLKNPDGTWKHHKYVAKLKNKFGNWIYFYSNEALQAYQKNQQRSDAFEKNFQNIKGEYEKAVASGDKDRAHRLNTMLANANKQREVSARETEASKDAYGKTARGMVDNAVTSAKNRMERMKADIRSKATNAATSARNTLDYNKDGTIDRKDLSDAVSGAKNKASSMIDSAKSKASSAASSARSALDYNKDGTISRKDFTDAASNAVSRAKGALDYNKDGSINRQDLSSAMTDAKNKIKEARNNIGNMTTEQIRKMNEGLTSSLKTAGDVIDSGREKIQNATGIGLRDTMNSLEQQLKNARITRGTILDEHSKAVDAGDTARAAELQRSFKAVDTYVSDLQKQLENEQRKYNNSIAGKVSNNVSNVSEATIRAIQEKWEAGKKLTQEETNQLFAFIFGGKE